MILATHGIISSAVGMTYTPPLDLYTGASAAYSLRKLRTAYTGYAIRVRRSSDNQSQDVGFYTNGNLDIASLLSFVGANDGFISIWYDQTTSVNDFIEPTVGIQPQIVSSGNVITQNSKPAIYFNGTKKLKSSRVFSTSNFSIFSTLSGAGQSDATFLAQHTGFADLGRTVFISPTNQVSPYTKLQTFFNNGSSRIIISANSVFDNTLKLINITSDGSGNTYQYVNSSLDGSLTGQNWTPLNTNLSIGALGNDTSRFVGYTNELICYTTNQTTNKTGIENNIKNYYSI
jgi:hypothetical protein